MTRLGLTTFLWLAMLTLSQARGGTVDTFTIENTSNITANDVTVGFKQKISKVGPNNILDDKGADSGFTWEYRQAASTATSLVFREKAADKPLADILTGESFKLKVVTNADKLELDPANTYFTEDGNKIQNSTTKLGASLNFSQDPNTGIASVSTGNDTDRYVFMLQIQVWTGLTFAQVTDYDSNGNLITSGLGAPDLTPADQTLAPGTSGNPIGLGVLPVDAAWNLVLYDMWTGPTPSLIDATNYGQIQFAASSIPEPSSFVLLVTGAFGLAALSRPFTKTRS